MAQGRGPDYELCRYVDNELRRFLDSQGANAPALREASWHYLCEHDEHVLLLEFHGAGLNYNIRIPRGLLRRGRVQDLTPREIVSAYSRLYEDHLLELQLEPQRRALLELSRVCADPHTMERYSRRFDDFERHLRRNHQVRFDPQTYFGMDLASGPDRTTVTMRRGDMTATQVVQQQAEAMRTMAQISERLFENLDMSALLRDLGIPGEYVRDPKAEARGLALLKAWLSSEQLAAYEKHKHFEVIGGHSGKRYRINHGRQMNIDELDRNGEKVCGWCFLPEGQLVAGDVMLAQKIALETNERKALKVANQFRMRNGHWQQPLPTGRRRTFEPMPMMIGGRDPAVMYLDDQAEIDMRPGAVNYVDSADWTGR